MTEHRFQKDVSHRAKLRAFKHAFRGICTLLATQWNARVHLVATVLVVGAGFWWKLRALEWCVIVFAIAIVWIAEAINTALEFFLDFVSPEINPLIGKAKDLAAGAVLLAAIAAAVVGLIVFLPKILGSALVHECW